MQPEMDRHQDKTSAGAGYFLEERTEGNRETRINNLL